MRFAEVATREVQTGQLREPTWRDALQEAGQHPESASDLYVKLRVQQMLKDETTFESWNEQRRTIWSAGNDSFLTFGRKNGLLGLGVLVTLSVALAWLLRGR